MSDDRIYLNGIDGVTGQYLVPPLSAAEAVAAARDRPPEKGLAGWLERISRSAPTAVPRPAPGR